MPPPGARVLAIHQPVHKPSYANFEGDIPRGQYGGGSVTRKALGQILLTHVQPDRLAFTVQNSKYPEHYSMIRPNPGKNWMLRNDTPTEDEPYREDGEFTHDGEKYNTNEVLSASEGNPIKDYPVEDLKWMLDHDQTDPDRLAKADPNTPGLVAPTADGRLAVVDGLHRLKKLVDSGGTHFKGRDAVLNKVANEQSKLRQYMQAIGEVFYDTQPPDPDLDKIEAGATDFSKLWPGFKSLIKTSFGLSKEGSHQSIAKPHHLPTICSSMHPSLTKLAFDFTDPMGREDQKNKDIGTAGMLAGSALMADTARTGLKGLDLSEKLQGLATRVSNNPTAMLKAETSIPMLKEYAANAGEMSKLRILGIPAGSMLSKAPISAITSPGGIKDLLNMHLFKGRGMDINRKNQLRGQMGHYKGFMQDANKTLLNEILNGGPFTDNKNVFPIAKRLGLRPDELNILNDGRMHDPLGQLQKMVKSRGGNTQNLDAMVGRTARYLFGSGQSGGVIRRGGFDHMAARNFGPGGYAQGASALSKVLIPLGLLGSAGLGVAGGKRLYDDHVKIAGQFADLQNRTRDRLNNFWNQDVLDRPTSNEFVGNAALTGAGVGLMRRGIQYAPSNLIAVTAGRIAPPVSHMDVGAGHVTPAKAIMEALREHPAVRSGEFVPDMALRGMDQEAVKAYTGKGFSLGQMLKRKENMKMQLPFALENRATHGLNNALVTVDSGFGASAAHGAGGMWWRKPEFNVNPSGMMGFYPDSTNHIGNDLRVIMNGNPSTMLKRMPLMTFGQGSEITAKGFDRLSHSPVHPAIQNSVLDLAESRLKNPVDSQKVWHDLAARLEHSGDTTGATTLRDALASGKKMVSVTGSSRGDFVAQRIKEMAEAMRTDPELAKKVQMVGFLGSQHGESTASRLMQGTGAIGVPNTGKLYQDGSKGLFDLVNASDRHYGSTGASAYAEANLSRTPSDFVTKYNDMRDRLHKGVTDMGRTMSEAEAAALKAVDLEKWNNGPISEIRSGLGGHRVADTGSDFVKNIRAMIDGKLPTDRSGEALKYLEQARTSKAELADTIIQHARKIRSETTGKMTRRLGAGGVMAAIGGLGLADALRRGTSSTPELFKERMNKLV